VATSLDDVVQRLRARECNCEQSQELQKKLSKALERIEKLRSALIILPVECDCDRNVKHYSDCPAGIQESAIDADNVLADDR